MLNKLTDKIRFDQRIKIVLGSGLITTILLMAGLVSGDPGVLGNLIIISTFVMVVPYFLHRYVEMMWVRSAEGQFPNFVRDLADSVRSGMSLPEALRLVSKGNYGKLTPEIIKMSNRLSWGTSFLRTLDIFDQKVKDSRIISEANKILRQSYESGGNIVSTLESISRDMLTLKEAEAERSSLVKQQIFIMYGIFYMFLGIAIMIIMVMVPMIESQPVSAQTETLGLRFSNPCCPPQCLPDCGASCIQLNGIIFPCGFFPFIGAMFGIEPGSIASYYVALFFSSIMIQGLFIGLITGQLGENSTMAGLKHSLIMMFSAFGIFLFIAKLGLLPV